MFFKSFIGLSEGLRPRKREKGFTTSPRNSPNQPLNSPNPFLKTGLVLSQGMSQWPATEDAKKGERFRLNSEDILRTGWLLLLIIKALYTKTQQIMIVPSMSCRISTINSSSPKRKTLIPRRKWQPGSIRSRIHPNKPAKMRPGGGGRLDSLGQIQSWHEYMI